MWKATICPMNLKRALILFMRFAGDARESKGPGEIKSHSTYARKLTAKAVKKVRPQSLADGVGLAGPGGVKSSFAGFAISLIASTHVAALERVIAVYHFV